MKKNNIIDEMLAKISPQEILEMEKEMWEHLASERWLEEQGFEYATPNSYSLKVLNEAGFFPIGITWNFGEELFIFKTQKEADEAWESHLLGWDGWWYSKADFEEEIKEEECSKIYWL